MPHSDAIIAGMDTSGQRLYVSDRWISGYTSPVKDHVDNIINWEWKQESNMTIFYFVRRADTGDYDQVCFLDYYRKILNVYSDRMSTYSLICKDVYFFTSLIPEVNIAK